MSTTPKKPPASSSTPATRSSHITPHTIQQTCAELDAALIADGDTGCLVIEVRAALAAAEAQETLNGPSGEPTDLRRARVIFATAELRQALAEAEIAARENRTRVERARAELERVNLLLALRKSPPA